LCDFFLSDETDAMAWDDRIKRRVKNFFSPEGGGGVDDPSLTGTGDGDYARSESSSRRLNHHHDNNNNNGNNNIAAAAAGGGGSGGGGYNSTEILNKKTTTDLDNNNTNNDEKPKLKQYKLGTTSREPPLSWWQRMNPLLGLFRSKYHQASTGVTVGLNPNQEIANYLHWIFRIKIFYLIVFMFAGYLFFSILFAIILLGAGYMDENCIRIGPEDFNWTGTAFADAFALAWQSFTTVGYGNVYPSLGYQNDSPTSCFLVSFICCLECTLGILYAGYVYVYFCCFLPD
jgi:hypothetical protein